MIISYQCAWLGPRHPIQGRAELTANETYELFQVSTKGNVKATFRSTYSTHQDAYIL
jgi:hypothetical protein